MERQYYNANYVTYRGKGSKEYTEVFEERKNWILLAWQLLKSLYIVGSMGCQQLKYQNFYFLEIVHSKKRLSEEKKRINYYPFGLEHKGYNNVVNGTHHPYGFGGKEEQKELGLNWHDFGSRNFDASLGRWMNLDPLAEGYENWSPYSYAFNNPIYFVDPDGERIRIGDNYYAYEKDRDYSQYGEFEANAYKALDKLYSSDAMNIDFGGDIGVVNVLDKLIGNKKLTVNITQSANEGSTHSRGNIKFADKYGITTATKAGVTNEQIKKAAENGETIDGVGRNSATSQLGHELVHSFNYFFDQGKRITKNGKRIWDPKKGGFDLRKRDKSTRSNDPNKPHYKNGEEKRTTTLSNQINKTLGEAQRFDHRGTSYRTESPTSTKPLKVKADD